ncbi:MAG: dihydroorotase [bacterium]|nr:dihydroorotase [bacterium]MDT8396652.1 dihydroorotase [bacterium]
MKWLISNGRIVDPASGRDEVVDLLLDGGVVAGIGKGLEAPRGCEKMDAAGFLVMPGFIDMHCHLREPGFEYKETVASGCAAAVKGGITSVMCMANTNPVNDCASVTSYILEKARLAGLARVYPVGSVTKGMAGESLSEMGELADCGCVAVSDDGRPVPNGEIMRRAIQYAAAFGLFVIDHAEDLNLAGDGVMHEGYVSTMLGLEGIPAAAAVSEMARNIAIIREFGGRIHIAHVSSRGAVDLIRHARAEGLKVSAETCPHYFTLTHEAVIGYDTSAKVKPPIRTVDDREAVIEGLVDGTIEVIATDHAPHHRDEKDVEFDHAAFGISGFETALALTLSLVESGRIGLMDAVARWTVNPARVAGLPGGTLADRAPADVVIVDQSAKWTVEPGSFLSRGKNTPLAGMELTGQVVSTFVGGRKVYDREEGIIVKTE